MQSLKYVTTGDRHSVVMSQASDLIKGVVCIGESINMIDELINAKQYFSDFYGDQSHEYKLSKELLNLLRMINRSVRLQKESETQKIQNWVERFPIRVEYVRRLEGLIQ